LKEWKAKAVSQLDMLFKKLRKAVPMVEHRELEKKYELSV
jgi:hypothetical protein